MHKKIYRLLCSLLFLLASAGIYAQNSDPVVDVPPIIPNDNSETTDADPSTEESEERTKKEALRKEITIGAVIRTNLYLHEMMLGTSDSPPFDITLGTQIDGNIGGDLFSFYFQFAVLMPLVKAHIYFYDAHTNPQQEWKATHSQRTGLLIETTLGGGITSNIGKQMRLTLAGGLHLAYLGHYLGELTELSTTALNFLLIGGAASMQFILPLTRKVYMHTGIFTSLDTGTAFYQHEKGSWAFISQVGISLSVTIY